jgi:hypothetical protein
MTQFNEAGQLTAPMWFANDQEGRVIAFARAHATLTAGTPYRIKYDEYGPFTAALANDQDTYRVGVAKAATVTGAIAELVHGGPYSGMITATLSMAVGEAVKVAGGACADEAADFDDLHDNMFAVAYTATTNALAQDVILIPEVITAT